MIVPGFRSPQERCLPRSAQGPFGRGLVGSLATVGLLGLLVVQTEAAKIPPLIELPAAVAHSHPELVDQRAVLVQERSVLRARTESHNGACGQVEEGTAQEASCRSALAALTVDVDHHIDNSHHFNTALRQAIQSARRNLQHRIDQARANIRADQEQVRRLGIDVVTNAFETWGDLADEQQRELYKRTILSAIALGANLAKEGSCLVGSFTPPQANAMISWLRAKGVTEPFLEEGIRKVAMTSGKPEMAKNVQAVAEMIEKGTETSQAFSGLANGQLEALATVLGAFLKTPDAKGAQVLGESLVNFYFASKALGVIEPDLNQVMNLPDQQLASVKRLSAAIRTDVDQLNKLKRDLTQLP